MTRLLITAVTVALAVTAMAAPTKDPADLTGVWMLEERSSDDPVRVLRGERGRGGRSRVVVSGGTIFGVPIGKFPGGESDDDEGEDDEAENELSGVEHVFEATYRLSIRRDGNVTEILYGNEPTIAYRDNERLQRDGATARASWEGGTFTVRHELADGSLVTERYWVDARSADLFWTVQLTRRKGSADIKRSFDRAEDVQP